MTTATRTQLDWRIQYAMLALIWGSSFLFIVIAVEVLDPLQVAFGRVAIGAATLLVILRVLRQQLPRGGSVWGHLLVAGLFYNVVPFALLAYAGERVPSALSGLLNATTPLFTLVIALAVLPSERPTRQRALGLAVGFFGVLIIFGVGALNELTGTLPGGFWAGSAMVLGASACYGLASVYTRITLAGSGYTAVQLSAGQVTCATAELVVVTLLFTDAPDELPARVVLSMLALGALGTGVSYILFWNLLRSVGPTLATTVTYLFPVVAVVLGVLFRGDRLTWNELLGGAVVIAGAALAQRTAAPRRPGSDAGPSAGSVPPASALPASAPPGSVPPGSGSVPPGPVPPSVPPTSAPAQPASARPGEPAQPSGPVTPTRSPKGDSK